MAEISTVYTYPLDGSRTDFDIPFEYLARKFVQVTLIGADRRVLVLNTDYRFVTKSVISTTRAWGPGDNYELIEIRRYTSATERLVDFTDGSILRAYDLNVAQVQTLHVAEEARDLTADTIGVNNDGDLDARGRRIVNVADGITSGDVITLGQVTSWNDSALNSKNAAKVSETNAKDSENKSKTYETNAKTYETNTASSRDLARKWATEAPNVVVQNGEYSAYHWATRSAASSSASLASQAASKDSENKSKTSENNAKTSETNAKTEADRAKSEADKLGGMNELASLIAETNTTTKVVAWGATQIYRPDPILVGTMERSYRARWETSGSSAEAAAWVSEIDGGMMFGTASKHETDSFTHYMVSDGTFSTGRILAWQKPGKDVVAMPSIFNQTILHEHSGNRTRYHSNGDIVWEAGQNIWQPFWDATSIQGALNNLKNQTIVDVYLGTEGSVPLASGSNRSARAPAGHFLTGALTLWRDADGTFIQTLYYRAIWKRYGSGQAYIVGQL